jgi:short-subunit dehydrogenase
VVLCGRSQPKLDQLARELATRGAIAFPRICDLTSAAIEPTSREVLAEFEHVDYLTHAAGDGPVGGIFGETDDEWLNTAFVKMFGTIRLTRLVAASMIRRGCGRIALINGTFAQQPHPCSLSTQR